MIPVTFFFETFGFTNKEGHVLLYVILAILSLSSIFFCSEYMSLEEKKDTA